MNLLLAILIGILIGLILTFLYWLISINVNNEIARLRKMGCVCEINNFGIPTVERNCPVHGAWLDD